MAENNESFLGILGEYFSNLEDAQVIEGTTKRIVVPMGWLSAEPEEPPKNKKNGTKIKGKIIRPVMLDGGVVEKAFINLINEYNKSYGSEKLKPGKKPYETIQMFEIEITETGVNLVVVAPDNRGTKLVVTEDKTLRGEFCSIDERKLYKAILWEYNHKSANQLTEDLGGRPEEKRRMYEDFKKNKDLRMDLVRGKMIKAAQNLVKYYEYWSRRHIEAQASFGVIQQKKGEGHRGGRTGHITVPRVSEIYEFETRADVFEEMHPCKIINIHNIESDNSVTQFAYITYVYQNPRDRQGYLIVAEPFEGKHNTRVRFVSQEEFDKLQVSPETDKLVHFAEKTTEMSNDEFVQTRFCKTFKHTSIEEFRRKFRRIVLGEKVEEAREEPRYKEADEIIFDGKRRRTTAEIRKDAEGATASGIATARTELYGREEKIEEKKEGEEPSDN